MKRKLLFILFSLGPACLFAGTGPKINFPFNGINFIINNNSSQPVMQATAPGNINWAAQVNSTQEFYSFQNTLELYQYESTDLPVNFEYDLTIKGLIEYQELGSSAFISHKVVLHINNHQQGGSRRIDFYSYSNAYNSKFTIISVDLTGTPPSGTDLYTAVSKVVELNFGMTQTHYIQPDLTLPVSISSAPCIDDSSNELVLSWPALPYAEEYELEVLYVDDYNADGTPLPQSAIRYDFAENATRIVLNKLFYRLPLVYDRGYVLYRIRPVGRGGPLWDKRIPGPWSAGTVPGTVDNFTAKKYIPASEAHTRNSINWQLTTTYAEDGKRKDVVLYSDGLYMTRQTVTGVSDARNMFTENINDASIAIPVCAIPGMDKIKEIVAQEDIYDFNGRVGVQMMPVPTGTHRIDYIPHLNKNTAGVPYSWHDFDVRNGCSLLSGQLSQVMSGAFGAGVYYSQNNPNKLGYNAFIPDAAGYPFSRVQYTDDNTGRLSRQGGVGQTFQLESGHETKFYYGTPNQVELDRMFGTEVGYAWRYLKKMVVDPNGQTAVTFENPEGKTIATALAGVKPGNLIALDNEPQTAVKIDVDLMAEDSTDNLGHSKTVNKQFLVTATGEYKFNYMVNGQALQYVTCDNAKVCLDCIYDLAISIHSNDGCTTVPVLNYTGTFGDMIKGTNVPHIDKTCFNGDPRYEVKSSRFPNSFDTTLNPGSYTIQKTLTVNKNAADAYVNLVFKDTCRAEFNVLLSQEMAKVDTLDCNQSCASCKVTYPNNNAQCAALCVKPLNDCDQARKMMLEDLKPGGQYAQFSVDSNGRYYSNDPLSIFNPANSLTPNAGLATAIVNLSITNPSDSLNINNRINNWNLSTAQEDILLQSHPEHCMLDWCNAQNTGKDYDLKLRTTDNYSDAVTLGLINSGSTAADTYVKLLNADPFFPNGSANYTSFLNFMNTTCSANGENLLQMAMYAAYCSSTPAMQNMANNISNNQGGPAAVSNLPGCDLPAGYLTGHTFGTNAYDWKMLRDLYLSYKEKYLYNSRLAYSTAAGCFNGCIGTNSYWLNYTTFPLPAHYKTYSAEGEIPIPLSPATQPCGVFYGLYQNKVKRFTSRYDAFSHTTSQTPVNLGTINLYDDCPTLQNTTAIQTQLGGIVNNFVCDSIKVTNDVCQFLCNSNFEQILHVKAPAGYVQTSQDNVPCWKTTAPDGLIEIWHSGFNGVPSYSGSYFAELNATQVGALYQTFSSTDTKNVIVSFGHRGRYAGFDKMKVSIGPEGGPYTDLGTYADNNAAWRYYSTAPYTINAGNYRVIFQSISSNNGAGPADGGNFLDTVSVTCVEVRPGNGKSAVIKSRAPIAIRPALAPATQKSTALVAANYATTNVKPAPCPLSDFTGVLNTYLPHLQGRPVIITGKQVPVSLMNGTAAISSIKMEEAGGRYTITTYTAVGAAQKVAATIVLARPAGAEGPVKTVCCPAGAGANALAFNLTYGNGSVFTVSTQANYPWLKPCDTRVPAKPDTCKTLSPFANELFNLLNNLKNPKFPKEGIYTYTKSQSALYTEFPGSGQISYQFSAGSACKLNFNGQGAAKGKTCAITFESCGWMDTNVSLVSITPYFDNGITQTNKFILTYRDHSTSKTMQVKGVSNCLPVNQCKDPLLCSADSLLTLPQTTTNYNACVAAKYLMAHDNAEQRYTHWLDSMRTDLLQKYYAKCMRATEKFDYSYTDDQFHYTLYYYDQAGNLTRTIPPAGVRLLGTAAMAAVDADRDANSGTYVPSHFFITNYKYNSLNQLIWQSTPDAGNSAFFYDKLGRIAASQNAKQHAANNYSYTYYDILGRTIESGELVSFTVNQSDVDNYAGWRTFLHSAPQRRDITFTRYDEALNSAINSKFGPSGQQNLRGRVASILSFADNNDQSLNHYRHATHYSYDVNGYVPVVIQDYRNTVLGEKVITYSFDLVSGKVNEVRYEPGMQDEFRHRYYYDDELRLTNVYTSRKGIIWQRDAEYFYYKHGNVARAELGQLKVQGLDYIYTLQGWIKGVNGVDEDITQDAGRDGIALNNPKTITEQINGQPVTTTVETNAAYNTSGEGYHSLHNPVAADAFGYVLSYYDGDYKPIAGSLNTTAAMNTTMTNVQALYNGNISRMYTYLQTLGGLGMNYGYDQLSRLKYQLGFTLSGSTPSPANAYQMDLNYDGNGNIINLLRQGRQGNLNLDKLAYHYYNSNNVEIPYMGTPPADATNRLASVTDQANAVDYPETGSPVNGTVTDIDNQQPNNYTYDAIGNMTGDNSEGISLVKWNLQNKITEIDKTAGQLNFSYDAMGNRVYKKYAAGGASTETYYVRDASGTIMGAYEYKNGSLTWKEHELYGSSRLGLWQPSQIITAGGPAWTGTVDWQNIQSQSLTEDSLIRGSKQYELTNHLGNVLATISDRKIQTNPAPNGTSGITADLLTATDYYAFGMEMPGRNFNGGAYRFGFNGKENDNEVKGDGNEPDYGMRIYDPRLARFLSIDPLTKKYPMHSPYTYCAGNPILFVDRDGKDWFVNNKTGLVIYIKDASQVNQQLFDKFRMNGNPNDYDRLGASNMFGEKVNDAYGNNILKTSLTWIDYPEAFMNERGYVKADKVSIVETEQISGGSMGQGENIKSSIHELEEKSEVKITYVKPEKLNKKDKLERTFHKYLFSSYEEVHYDLTKPHGQDNHQTSEIPANRRSETKAFGTELGLKIGELISTLLEPIEK